jgi:hypothetical protein
MEWYRKQSCTLDPSFSNPLGSRNFNSPPHFFLEDSFNFTQGAALDFSFLNAGILVEGAQQLEWRRRHPCTARASN